MKYSRFIVFSFLLGLLSSCGIGGKKAAISCTDPKCQALSCKLTSAEMRERKATVIASLQKQVIEKKELKDGYAFKFTGSDAMVDELTTFIKTERQCCDFFTFNLSVKGDHSAAWLELTGPEGAKEFIKTELGL